MAAALVSLCILAVSYGYGQKHGFSDMSRLYEIIEFQCLCPLVGIIALPICMFYPYSKIKERYQNRSLLMLPASNLEKYITHYAFTWLFFLSLSGGILIADILQYAVHTMMGHEGARLMIQELVQGKLLERIVGSVNTSLVLFSWGTIVVWLHSVFALEATFFKSYKPGVNLTISLLFVFGLMIFVLFGFGIAVETWWNNVQFFNAMFLLLTPVNFLLSYYFFCRQQITARFINI
ncbi:MAG: hypothetical protein IJV60_03150 [Prevotella sp.]|nr:hypothetical protein [Prevotella sp.]MBQ8059740.1 hypothetical protein [Prevotella sp.]